jgi:hypothetical protein
MGRRCLYRRSSCPRRSLKHSRKLAAEHRAESGRGESPTPASTSPLDLSQDNGPCSRPLLPRNTRQPIELNTTTS